MVLSSTSNIATGSGGKSPNSAIPKSQIERALHPPRKGLRSNSKQVSQQAGFSKTETDSSKVIMTDHTSVAGQLKELAAENKKLLKCGRIKCNWIGTSNSRPSLTSHR